jgi:hypothetical protein
MGREDRARLFLKAQIKRADVTYAELGRGAIRREGPIVLQNSFALSDAQD